jgi:hypothetical protein
VEYRTTVPEDGDYEDDADERDALHEYVQGLMTETGSDEVMDSLLIVANLCEARALVRINDESGAWYANVGKLIRGVMECVTTDSDFGLPDSKLEDPMLYYPPVGDLSH